MWNPIIYNEFSFMQFKTAMLLLETFKLYENDLVLDIGCGTGKITSQIAEIVRNGHVTGVDISEDMLAFAKEHNSARNLNYNLVDVLKLDYENKFDVVVSFWTLSWVNNISKALGNIVRALKQNGRILLMYPMKHNVYCILDELIEKPAWKGYFIEPNAPRPFYNEQQLAEILAKLPLAVQISSEEIIFEYADISDMKKSIRSWLPHLSKLPNEETKEQFLDELVELYVDTYGTSNGNPYMAFNTLNIRGRKLTIFEHLMRAKNGDNCASIKYKRTIISPSYSDTLELKARL